MSAPESAALVTPETSPAPATGPHSASPGDLIDGLDTQDDPVVLADLLRYARDTRKEWLAAEQAVETRLAEVAGVGQHEPAPGSVFIVRQSAERVEWAHDEVRRAVTTAARQNKQPDPDTGEVLSDWEAVAAAIWACVPGSPSWRVGGLKALGLDASQFRTKTPGRKSVELI